MDDIEQEISVPVDAVKARYTVGLLGADIEEAMIHLPSQVTATRLAEIERRILAIEAMVWPLGR